MAYHHGNLRAALVDAATEVVETDGPDALTLREVARRVGVSHNAAYRHFDSREALVRAVASRGVAIFGTLMAEHVAGVRGRGKAAAYKRLEASGRAYVEFAIRHTGLFRIIFQFGLGEIEPDDDVQHPYRQLGERLDELVTSGAITPARRANAEVAAFAGVHGFALLVVDGPWRDASAEDVERDLQTVLRVVSRGL